MRAALTLLAVVALGCSAPGPEWLRVETPITRELRAISGASATDVWVVGDSGAAMRFGGASIQALDTGVSANLNGVWARAPDDVWLVGEKGLALRFDGQRFTRVDLAGIDETLTWVAGVSATDVYFGSSRNTWQWDGSAVSKLTRGSLGVRVDAWAITPGALWVVIDGDTLMVGSGGAFAPVDVEVDGSWTAVAVGPGGVWLYDRSGERLLRFDGLRWSATPMEGLDVSSALKVGWAPGPDHVWFAGGQGAIVHVEDGVPTVEVPPDILSGSTMVGLWGASADDMWAVGSGGVLLRRTLSE